MPKKTILVLYLSACSSFCIAQVKEFGLRMGIIGTKSEIFVPAENLKYKNHYGYSIFLMAHAQVYSYQNMSVRAGIGVMEKNNIYNDIVDGAPIALPEFREFLSRYIAFNSDLKIRAKVKQGSSFTPYVFLGPSLQFLQSRSDDIGQGLQKFQVHGQVGAGFDYDLPSINLFFELQRYFNFNQNLSTDANGSYKAHSYVLCIGFKYLLKEKL